MAGDAEAQMPNGAAYLSWRATQGLSTIPDPPAASRHAAAVRRLLGDVVAPEAPLADLSGVCAATGMVVHAGRLRGAAGGIEAIITPLDGDRFRVVVDAEPRGGWRAIHRALRADLERQRFRFRLAHELAHTLFYDRSGPWPRRRLPVSQREEVFCDRFARAVLLPDDVIATCPLQPADVLRLQREYDVSLETTVRAFAEVHREVFFGLLLAKGPREPRLRPQWVSPTFDLPPRWWAAEWVQRSLFDASLTDEGHVLRHGCGAMRCLWRALPVRGQVLIIGMPAS